MKQVFIIISVGLLLLGNIAPVIAKEEAPMHKLIFVLNITREDVYSEYRETIRPLMDRLGIVVLNEYDISTVIHSQSTHDKVNRLAVFGFPTESIKTTFFSDPIYLEAKKLFTISTENFVKIME